MHEENTKRKLTQYYLNVKRSFYSLCRKANGITIDDEDIYNEKIEQLRNFYNEKDSGINKYINILDNLNRSIVKKNISPNDALIVLVNVIDPEYKMYSLFDETDEFEAFKRNVQKEFKFFDKDLFNIEKKYVESNNLQEEFNLVYKKEV